MSSSSQKQRTETLALHAGWRADPSTGAVAVPDGADAYLIRHLLHNYDDDDCVKMLGNVRRVGAQIVAEASKLPHVVQVHGRHARVLGYLPHDESVDLIRTADLLFLPMHDLPPGVRATIVPGKTYEYLASGTPILGAVPAGDARDFLLASGRAVVCDPDDVEGMSRAIEAEISRPSGRPPFSVEGDKFLAAFERDRLAGRLAEVFDGVLGTQQ